MGTTNFRRFMVAGMAFICLPVLALGALAIVVAAAGDDDDDHGQQPSA